MQIAQKETKTKLVNQRNLLVVAGTISHLKTTYLGSTKKRKAGMGNGKSGGKVMPTRDFTRC